MPQNHPSTVTGTGSTILLCIDSVGAGKMVGYLHNSLLREPYEFVDIVQVVEHMDTVFEEYSFPHAFFSTRRFFPKASRAPVAEEGKSLMQRYALVKKALPEAIGKKGTFLIQVYFRQHATWQGEIIWLDKNKRQYFQSALEMLQLLHAAFVQNDPAEQSAGWK